MFDIKLDYTIDEKLHILADAAKYDVACTSSGVERKGKEGFLGNAKACGICHSFASDGRCISLLKILMTNDCVYDCKYCINRKSNDVKRATFTPDEICQITIEFYKRNYIEGLFLSSGVINNPAYTMEKICETLHLLRTKYKFNGYIHVKTIPGAPDELLVTAGYLSDIISINMELPTEASLKKLAPNKTFSTILTPMKKVSDTIGEHRVAKGLSRRLERSNINKYLEGSIFKEKNLIMANERQNSNGLYVPGKTDYLSVRPDASLVKGTASREFAPAGQSTQMIIGATPETDYMLIKTTQAMYQHYDLKRVFYSAYIPLNEDSELPDLDFAPPLLREHRLYQADWLLRFYGFNADELLSEESPNFNEHVDPKCNYALNHLDMFPIEVQRASYDELLRVPGIGPKSAKRIVDSRRYCVLDFDVLKKLGVVLKRAHYFITCSGKMMYKTPIEQQFILRQLTSTNEKENWQVAHQNDNYRQMSLFSDFGVG